VMLASSRTCCRLKKPLHIPLCRHQTPPQASPAAAAALGPEALADLFMSALRATGSDAPAAAPRAAARVLLDAGVLGCGAHLRRHPQAQRLPPYDPFRCAALCGAQGCVAVQTRPSFLACSAQVLMAAASCR
jgi:hypothetical protein